MNKKLVCAALLIAMLLAACTDSTSPTAVGDAPSEKSVTTDTESDATILRFAVSDMDRGQYDGLIQAFEAENPDVHIKTVSIEGTLGMGMGMGMGSAGWPDDAYLLLAAAADVISMPATREAVQQGALLDLSPFIESDPNLAPEDFYPALLESVQWDGGIWSLPAEANYQLITYDKDLFDAAGVAYPQPGWSWDDFLATAQALTVREGDVTTQWGFVQPTFDAVTFVQARAGLLFDPETYPTTARLDSPDVVEAVRWYTDLFLVHQVAPYYAVPEQDGFRMRFGGEGMQLVENGQAAMWFGSTGMPQMRGGFGQQEQNYGSVPFPVSGPEDRTTPVIVDGFSISRGTNKTDLAWQWVSFLGQQRARQRGPFDFMSSNAVPALPSVAAASGFWDNLDEESAAVLNYAIEHAYVDTYDGEGYDTFSDTVVDVIENGSAIESALADAQSTVEDEIEAALQAVPTPVADLTVAEEEDAAIDAGAVIIQFGMSEGYRFGQQSYRNLVEQFQEAHPGIIVELKTPQGFRGGLSLADMAAEYDCFQSSPNLSNEDDLAAILSMEPFFAADSDLGKEDFYPSVMDQFTYQGQVWGLPGSVTVNVMSYNKDLFDAAGLDYPSVTWTTSDFLELATALTQGEDENAQYGYASNFFEVNDLVALIDRLGGDMLDDSVDPPRVVFNTPGVVEAVRWYASLTTVHGVKPTLDTEVEDFRALEQERQAMIDQGRVAMWTDASGVRVFRGFGGETNLNTGIAPLPLGPNSAEGSGFQSVDGFFISAQTDARQACWTWITFLTEQPNVASGLPARQSVAESDAYRQEVGAEQAEAYIASVSSGSRASFMQRISEEGSWLMFASFWLSDAYDRIVAGDMTVEEALNAAQDVADAYRDCAIANDAFQDMEALQECSTTAAAVAPELAGDD
jgi:multiple sugar transport system substrate-binding protein